MQTIFCFLWVLDVLVKSQSNLGKRCLAISHLEFGHLISTSRWKCVLLLNASSTLHEILGARKQCYCCYFLQSAPQYSLIHTRLVAPHQHERTRQAWSPTLTTTRHLWSQQKTSEHSMRQDCLQVKRKQVKLTSNGRNASINQYITDAKHNISQHGVGYIQLLLSFATCVFSENNLDLMIPKPHWFLSCNLHCTFTISMLCFFWMHPEFETEKRTRLACCSEELFIPSVQYFKSNGNNIRKFDSWLLQSNFWQHDMASWIWNSNFWKTRPSKLEQAWHARGVCAKFTFQWKYQNANGVRIDFQISVLVGVSVKPCDFDFARCGSKFEAELSVPAGNHIPQRFFKTNQRQK